MNGGKAQSIPARLNLVITFAALAVCLLALYAASHAGHWSILLAAAIVFAFFNNTLFALLHEAVHGVYAPDPRLNRAAGIVLAAMFPTSFTMQKIAHLGHHMRNRTDEELYDYYLPTQSRWVKWYWLLCLLTGAYWSIIPLSAMAFLLLPGVFSARWFQKGPARWWGFVPFVRDIAAHPWKPIWLELLFTAAFQTALWIVLDLNVIGWLACYWAFGLVWSAMQYVNHAWTERDVLNGAWNLRTPDVVRLIFLNYTLHLAHHQHPSVPWLYLPAHIDPRRPRPSFWKIYFSLWMGPQPAPPGPGPEPLDGASVS